MDKRIYMSDLYNDFINEYPDYAPKSKFTISRTKFNKWLNSYAIYKDTLKISIGRDMIGKWIHFENKKYEDGI